MAANSARLQEAASAATQVVTKAVAESGGVIPVAMATGQAHAPRITEGIQKAAEFAMGLANRNPGGSTYYEAMGSVAGRLANEVPQLMDQLTGSMRNNDTPRVPQGSAKQHHKQIGNTARQKTSK